MYIQMQARAEIGANYINQIDALAACGETGPAETVFIRMAMEGITPNYSAYCSLMGAYAKTEDVAACWNSVDQMITHEIELDADVANIILKTLSNKGTEKDYARLLSIMDQTKCDIIVYNVFVGQCLKNHLANIAWKSFEKLHQEKLPRSAM
jgi:Pentatricopeptide repeat domain